MTTTTTLLIALSLLIVPLALPTVASDEPSGPEPDDGGASPTTRCYAIDATKSPPEVYEVPCA